MLAIVFRDNLHQPQYVEKLDKLVRFCIKEKVLSLQDLDRIWAAQDGKHEIIVKNIHDLLVKLAWDFSPEQLDHLFGCFQVNHVMLFCVCCPVHTCTYIYMNIHIVCIQLQIQVYMYIHVHAFKSLWAMYKKNELPFLKDCSCIHMCSLVQPTELP